MSFGARDRETERDDTRRSGEVIKLVAYVDILAFGVLGGAVGQHLALRLLRKEMSLQTVEAGTGLGAMAAVFLVYFILVPGRQERPTLLRNGVEVLLALSGSFIGVSCQDFFVPGGGFWNTLRFVNLALLAGLLLTWIISRFIRETNWDDPGEVNTQLASIGESVSGIFLPAIALVLVSLRWGIPSFSLAMLAALGGFAGLLAGRKLNDCTARGLTSSRPAGRDERIQALVIWAGAFLIGRHALAVVPREVLTNYIYPVVLASIAVIGGSVLAASMINRLGTAPADGLGFVPWLIFSVPRVMVLFVVSAAGGTVVGHLVQGFRLEALILEHAHLSVSTHLLVAAGALLGALCGAGLCGAWNARASLSLRQLQEASALATSYLRPALPLGLILFFAAMLFVEDISGGFLFYFGLVHGPVLGGAIGVFLRMHKLYHPLSIQDWAVFGWVMAVTVLFAVLFQDVLAALLFLPLVLPFSFYVLSGILILMAVQDLLRTEPAADTAQPASEVQRPIEITHPAEEQAGNAGERG